MWWRSDTGSAAAELSVVAPALILLLLFVAVIIHRSVDARLRIEDVAHQAARAASIERSPSTAVSAARSTAAESLSAAGVVCQMLHVEISTGELRPGGVVRATVSCEVDLGDASMLHDGSVGLVSATATEPVDTWRSTAGSAS